MSTHMTLTSVLPMSAMMTPTSVLPTTPRSSPSRKPRQTSFSLRSIHRRRLQLPIMNPTLTLEPVMFPLPRLVPLLTDQLR